MKLSNSHCEEFMSFAINEDLRSLKEGNNGFGVIIVRNNKIIAQTHDKENTEKDPTSHKELNAIRLAAMKYGKNLSQCVLFCTNEPCPMCATAMVWTGIKGLVYGISIKQALKLGKKRIDIECKEIFKQAKADIYII